MDKDNGSNTNKLVLIYWIILNINKYQKLDLLDNIFGVILSNSVGWKYEDK